MDVSATVAAETAVQQLNALSCPLTGLLCMLGQCFSHEYSGKDDNECKGNDLFLFSFFFYSYFFTISVLLPSLVGLKTFAACHVSDFVYLFQEPYRSHSTSINVTDLCFVSLYLQTRILKCAINVRTLLQHV